MTQYYVNGRKVETAADFISFDQMLKTIEDHHLESGSVIREIHVDGRTLTMDRNTDDDCTFGQMENWKKIEIFTATLLDVARESAAGAQDYLNRIEKAVPTLVLRFQDIPAPEDFTSLRSLCEGFLFLNLLLDKLATGYRINFDQVTVRDNTVREQLVRFVGVVKQLTEAQECRDCNLITDTLEYEILPVVPVWKEIFTAVLEKINQSSALKCRKNVR